MIIIKEILRSKRKTLSIIVTPSGEVVVKAPIGLPDTEIYKFIQEKKSWIESRQSKISTIAHTYEEVINYQKLMIFGEIMPVFKSNNVKKVCVNEGKVLVPSRYPVDKLFKKFISFYKKLAEDYLIKRTIEIAKLVGLSPTSTQVTGSRGRWGACNSKGKIMLSWRAVLIKKSLIDYIIVHELAHLVELNHSPKFWSLVEKIYPKYKLARAELNGLGFVLKLF